jgi:hypothetical protein
LKTRKRAAHMKTCGRKRREVEKVEVGGRGFYGVEEV